MPPEVLSDDVYRYYWDGKNQVNNINPFIYAPENERLSFLRDNKFYPKINHKHVETIYPPVSQILFFLTYKIAKNNLITLRIIYLIMDIICFILIFLVTKDKGKSLLYLLCPLLIFENYIGMHLDIMSAVFLLIAFFAFKKKKYYLCFFFLIFSILTKYITVVVFPLFFIEYIKNRIKDNTKKHIIILNICSIIIITFSLSVILFLPYLNAKKYLFKTLIIYNEKWKFNAFFFTIFRNFFKQKTFIIKNIYLLLLLIVIYFYKNIRFIDKIKLCVLSLLLLSNTFYPWYLITIIPLMFIKIRLNEIFLILVLFVSYYILIQYLKNGIWKERFIFTAFQFIPYYLLLIFDFVKGKYFVQEK